MNTFYEHHRDSIRFGYRCFDRILLNGLIQPFQQPERIVGFFNRYRELYPVSKPVLKDIARQYEHWVTARAQAWGAPIVAPPDHQRRDDFVDRYFRRADPDQVVVILKAREPARILIAIGQDDRWHLEYARRWVIQYNFYLLDREWGRLFVRVCPYFPFSARMCLNQHHWLATRLLAEGISFRQCGNAFVTCSAPRRLQPLADTLTRRDLARCAQKWLRTFTPFFTPTERRDAACQHRLFLAQVEYCDNLIFRRRAALDALGDRLFDANRTIGQPTKLATIFGRKGTKRHRGKLDTIIEDLDLPNPVIRSYYRDGSIKQYVSRPSPVAHGSHVQQCRRLRRPESHRGRTTAPHRHGRRDRSLSHGPTRHPRDLRRPRPAAAARGTDAPSERQTHPRTQTRSPPAARRDARARPLRPHCSGRYLDTTTDQYRLPSLRYDLSKLRAKGLVERVPHARRYRLLPHGYSICLLFLKLFERVYAPLTAGLLKPVTADNRLADEKRHRLDRLYQRIVTDLEALLEAVGLRTAA
jgi:hypothetical protein